MNGSEVLAAVDISTRGAGLGLVGGLVVTAIVVASILLLRNMNQRVKRLPTTFDEPAAAADQNNASTEPPDAEQPSS